MHNEGLHNPYCEPKAIRKMKSRLTRLSDFENYIQYSSQNASKKKPFRRPVVDSRLLLERIIEKQSTPYLVRNELGWLSVGSNGGYRVFF
jgi:hypothetical protein